MYAGIAEGQEKYQEAIDEYLRIADYDENNPIIFLKLAELYEKTEGIIAAIEILERGLAERNYKDFEEILAGYYIRNSQPERAIELTKNDLNIGMLVNSKKYGEGIINNIWKFRNKDYLSLKVQQSNDKDDYIIYEYYLEEACEDFYLKTDKNFCTS